MKKSKAVPDLVDRRNVVCVNLGNTVGDAVRKIAEENQLNLSLAVRLLLKKAISKPGALARIVE